MRSMVLLRLELSLPIDVPKSRMPWTTTSERPRRSMAKGRRLTRTSIAFGSTPDGAQKFSVAVTAS